jgi:hypothetical protein
MTGPGGDYCTNLCRHQSLWRFCLHHDSCKSPVAFCNLHDMAKDCSRYRSSWTIRCIHAESTKPPRWTHHREFHLVEWQEARNRHPPAMCRCYVYVDDAYDFIGSRDGSNTIILDRPSCSQARAGISILLRLQSSKDQTYDDVKQSQP